MADRFLQKFTVTSCTRYCGYETETPGFARVWVARPDLFMVYMGQRTMRAGNIEDLLVRPDGRSCGPHLRHGNMRKTPS
ncbi:MAG: hypothetical protein ACLR6J_14065 [Parabacteroides merdae]